VTPWAPPNPGWRIKVREEGMYRLTRAELQVFTLRGAARERVAAAKLPQAAKDRLQAQLATAGADRLTEAAVADLIKTEGEYIARVTESGAVRVPDVALAGAFEAVALAAWAATLAASSAASSSFCEASIKSLMRTCDAK
jgi:hypothetical protein